MHAIFVPQIATLFETIDLNGDGVISKDEWRQGFAKFTAAAEAESEAAEEAAEAEAERKAARDAGSACEHQGCNAHRSYALPASVSLQYAASTLHGEHCCPRASVFLALVRTDLQLCSLQQLLAKSLQPCDCGPHAWQVAAQTPAPNGKTSAKDCERRSAASHCAIKQQQ